MSDKTIPGPTPAADCWASTAVESPCATQERPVDENGSSGRSERCASFGALLSAFIASSWCWLPPLLILGGVSGAGMTAVMQDYRPIFMVVTFGFLGLAFYLTYRPRRTTTTGTGDSRQVAISPGGRRSSIMTMNKVVLWGVTIVAIVFLFFPQALTSFIAADDEFTADMDRTVISIEGMTWHTWAPKAEKALKSAPGVLAVNVDFAKKQATIGTKAGSRLSTDEIFASLKSIGYTGKFVDPPRGRWKFSWRNVTVPRVSSGKWRRRRWDVHATRGRGS